MSFDATTIAAMSKTGILASLEARKILKGVYFAMVIVHIPQKEKPFKTSNNVIFYPIMSPVGNLFINSRANEGPDSATKG